MDRKLIELLICPVTGGPLRYESEYNVLISERAKLVYPVRDGIPIMLEQEALPLQTWEEQNKLNGNSIDDFKILSMPSAPMHSEAAPAFDKQTPQSESKLSEENTPDSKC